MKYVIKAVGFVIGRLCGRLGRPLSPRSARPLQNVLPASTPDVSTATNRDNRATTAWA